MFNPAQFSKDLKIQKLNYKEQQAIDLALIQQHIDGLAKVDIQQLNTDDEKKAFWINIYNGMTNYLIIHRKVKKEMKEDANIFSQALLNIGGFEFSLDHIEHGLLRQNARVGFKDNDVRKAFMVEKLDYRIHFALNCGAHSCPPIAFYSTALIDQQLQMAEDVFAEHSFIVNQQERSITCSQLFVWYQTDFPNIYLNDPQYQDFKIIELPYDWSI